MREYTVYHNVFIHNVFGSFFRSIADFFRTEWFGRSQDIIISTYEKAIEHVRKRRSEGGENWNVKYPFILFDPSYEFEPEPYDGKYLHGYPQFRRDIGSYMYGPKIYEDDNVMISPMLNRYQGTFDVTIWCSSVYELMDVRLIAYQFFGNIGRIIIPRTINGYFILPNSITTYSYSNPWTKEEYILDWNTTTCESVLIKTLSKTQDDLYFVFPFSIDPFIKLSGVSDGSDKYGGSGDEIGDHRLTMSIEWECSIPTHLVIAEDKLPTRCHKVDVDVGSEFEYVMSTDDGDKIATPREMMVSYLDKETDDYTRKDLVFNDNFIYILTKEDIDLFTDTTIEASTKSVFIPLPDPIEDCEFLRVYCKFGILDRDYSWRYTSNNEVELLGFNLTGLGVGDIITISIYKEDPGTIPKI